MIYSFTEADFLNASSVEIEKLQMEIEDAGLTSATVQYINSEIDGVAFSVDIVFDLELSPADFAVLSGIIAGYSDVPYDTYVVFKDKKTVGTNGGTFAKDTWTIRTLNYTEGYVNFAELKDDEVTIQAGRYILYIKSPACDVLNHQCRLYNITDATYIMGTNSFSANGVMTNSEIYTIINIAGEKKYRVEHICSANSASIGFGKATGFGTDEIYTTFSIQIS
jgi:hypothetical protein